jgi:hypothetical protein
LFRRGEVPREVRLLAAQGIVAPRAHEQLCILVFLTRDADAEIAATAVRTLDALPRAAVEGFLTLPDVAEEVRAYFDRHGLTARGIPPDDENLPLVDLGAADDLTSLESELDELLGDAGAEEPEDAETPERRPLNALPVAERLKLAMRGTRQQRALLVRDANKMVSAAVLSSPKLSESEVESFARMGNVSDDVLRLIGGNRQWTKSYAVVCALTRNPKTPPAVSMSFVGRLNERDLRGLSTDRNVPEGLRITARKLVIANESRRR